MGRRIHITGASGSGTSTLARALATRLGSQAFDTDDFYWYPTDPPFSRSRPVMDRIRLMEDLFLARSDWILSGSLHGWGASVMTEVTHVVFLTLNSPQRLARLRARERQRYGARIAPGGDLEAMHRGFLAWAMSYDDPRADGRSRDTHEAWLATLDVPVIRLDSEPPAEDLAGRVLGMLDERMAAQ